MRLVRLFAAIFAISLTRDIAFRTSFVFQVSQTVTTALAALATIGIVYTQTDTLAGWSAGGAIVLLGTYQIVSGVLATFIEPNIMWFSNQITSGRLDDMLLKPVSSLFLASLGSHAPLGLTQVLAGTIVLGIGLQESGAAPEVWNVACWLVMLAVGIAVTWATRVSLSIVALWAPSLSLDVVYSAVWQLGRYPVDIYRQPIRAALTFVLPLAFVSTIPARALTSGVSLPVFLIGLAVGVAAVTIVNMAWAAGLRRYTSATS